SLRIGVAGGLAETVIERNTPVPIEQTSVFTTFRDFQQSVKIRVYQGESRIQEENELLGEFEFSGFKNARRGEVPIEVTFEIDTDGIANVTARDPDTNQQASTRIHLSSGLSEEELRALVAKHQAAPPPDLPPEPARPSLPPLRVPGRPDPAPAEDLAAEDPIQLETSPGTWRGETGAYGSEIELDPGGAAEPGEPGEPAEERTQTIGGEIDLEPPGGDAPALAGADDLDPLDLDESDLE